MKIHHVLTTTLASSALICFSGCASIMSGSRKNIDITSNPSGAHVSIKDQDNREVLSLNTPCVANLKRGSGYFSPASYVVTIEKAGYQTYQSTIHATGNGWTLGNIVFGGLIGLLIVDPITGGMYMLSPSKIHAELVPTGKH